MKASGKRIILLALSIFTTAAIGDSLKSGFQSPPHNMRPETWFHLIGGNVSKPGLTTDLEAVAGAGISGIQLFHGRGGKWPEVSPQITCLSPSWDEMITHVGKETQRLGLNFTMQNCPGWAMSGGPWITPDKAMRHLVWSQQRIAGGTQLTITLDKPQPSNEDWRDYRDVAVLAFPTPEGDTGQPLIPVTICSNREDLPWKELLTGKSKAEIQVDPTEDSVWIELSFAEPVNLRSIELPPVENLMMRRNFDPDSAIHVQALDPNGWIDLERRIIPRGNWQDRLPEMSLFLAFSDASAKSYKIKFENKHPMSLEKMRLSSAACVNDWRGQAAYALRSLDRTPSPEQNPAAWVSSSSIVDLSTKIQAGGKLTWNAPTGNWTVVRFGHVNTGVKNKPAPPEATGFECDKLSAKGADQHFAGYIGRLTKSGGPLDAGQLKGMLIDSWECYTQTWTPAMENEFETRRGYALRRWLPAIAGWVVEDHQTSERFLRDWRATISDLLVENYFGRLTQLAKQRGLKLSFETAIGDVSPGDILQYFGQADIPMCEFWQPNDPHWGGFETKPIHPAVSAGHIYGKQRIAAESFTNVGIRWDEHPFALKHKADQHFALGINHLVFHTYTHNPRSDVVPGTSFGGRIGTPFLRGQTWWKYMSLFTDYLSRCQFLLQQGQPVADVLWYLGDDLDHKPRQDTPFPDGYCFDYVNFDALTHRINIIDGNLCTPERVQWKVLWLPTEACQRLRPETLERLQTLLNAGATVVGAPPKMNPSLSGGAQAEKKFRFLVCQLWGMNPENHGDRSIGDGRLLWGHSLEAMLSRLGITADVKGTQSATWSHRRTENEDIYFIAADRLSPLRANLRFRAQGCPEIWDPMTGTMQPVAVYTRYEGQTIIPLDLPAAGSAFIIFRSGGSGPVFTKIDYNGKTLIDATDLTKVDTGDPYPNFGLTPEDEIQPWITPAPLTATVLDGGQRILVWKDGAFTLTDASQKTSSITVKGTSVLPLETEWNISFPSDWDTSSNIYLPELKPWSELENPAEKHFSGTASYKKTIKLDAMEADIRYLLELGRVANIAEIIVNGKPATALWAPPFRVDITSYLQTGFNHIEIKVTNSWRNRLIYDASLPTPKRKTWTYSAPSAKEKVQEAGLIGPVQIHVGKVIELK